MTDSPKPPRSERLRALLPEVWSLMRPRRGVLALALVLMAVNRVAGLVLPGSTKLLVDDVIGARRVDLLLPLVAGGGAGPGLHSGDPLCPSPPPPHTAP